MSLQLEKIQAIIGPRRVGKTSVMFLAMDELRKQHEISPANILYFNFEDERLQFNSQNLDLLLQSWKELHPADSLDECRFFFDEVQAASGWERFYNNNIYYYTEPSSECDFIVYEEGGTALPIQVSWTLSSPDTRQREIKGLLKAASYCQVTEGLILTAEEEEDITIDGVHIQILPTWKWLLQSPHP
ncbi:AAA family ATPase [Albibacterium profundi]|uniref:AAA family ATPase n=1 Tax=Albibacterium profundi TaxID=3134906 RepID=A0ABV5CEM4_9SPHI